jgi:hypothetical protein
MIYTDGSSYIEVWRVNLKFKGREGCWILKFETITKETNVLLKNRDLGNALRSSTRNNGFQKNENHLTLVTKL